MSTLNKKEIITLITIALLSLTSVKAQNGYVVIDQDKKIDRLMEIKKQANLEEDSQSNYKIQVFSGDFNNAKSMELKVKSDFPDWPIKLDFDTPNYKIRVGSFKTRLEADKQLIEVRKKYPQAILLRPKKTT